MATTNIQSFSGDVDVASDLTVTGSATVTSNFTVDTNTLHVDSVAGRVGIGKTDPAYAMDVNGTVNASALYVGGSEFTGGGFDPDVNEIAIGTNAGQTGQGTYGVAVGWQAGNLFQGTSATAVGRAAGQDGQGAFATAVGYRAGYCYQKGHSTALGISAGETSQGSFGAAVGYMAGASNQSSAAVAIGKGTATYNQACYGVAVGTYAARDNQGCYAVAVGNLAGRYTQGCYAVAVGREAAITSQGSFSVAVGVTAGQYNQARNCVAVGNLAGGRSQQTVTVAIGNQAAYIDQGAYSVALGWVAGQCYQGQSCIALGATAGRYNQPNNTFYCAQARDANGSEYLHYNVTTKEVTRGNNYSDDRLKYNEKVITGAIKSLFKLRPEEYDKKPSLKPSHTGQDWKHESGLIAQEIYYSAPEFRHIVQVPQTAGDVEKYTPPPSDDPNQDPDYSVWGEDSPSVDYKQFVPYLIKAVQEIVTELPRSKTTVSNAWDQNIAGLVVSANANAHKTNTTPIVALSNVYMDKKWYGVVSNKTTDTNDYDTLVDTKGDTQIWVTDTGGPLESGDLVTTSNVAPGYTQKQADDLLRSSTVAKVTQDCDFTEPAQRPIRVPKRELSNVTYYLRVTEQDINLDAYEKLFDTQRKIKTMSVYIKEVDENEQCGEEQFFHGETQVSEEKYKTLPEDERSKKWVIELEVADYEKLTDEEKTEYTLGTRERWFVLTTTKSKAPIPEHDEEIVVEELVDVLDENGQIVWEETGETEPVYTLVEHGSYKAALVSAKLI